MTRLWHVDLLPYLPGKWLVSQFRECVGVTNQYYAGTINHAIVNRVKNYSEVDICTYNKLMLDAYDARGYKSNPEIREKLNAEKALNEKPFKGWHEDRYLSQCLFMLQEKYDVGMILEDDWKRIDEVPKFHAILESYDK